MRFKNWMEDLEALKTNTVAGFDTSKRHNVVDEVGTPTMALDVRPESKELLVKAKVPSSDQKTVYNASILFRNVGYKPIPHGGQMDLGSYLVTNPRTGIKYYLDKLSARNNDVQVACNCQDFRRTFSKSNFNQDALLGSPENSSQRNPQGIPGMCKHLLKVEQMLGDKGILTPGQPLTGGDPVHKPAVSVPRRKIKPSEPKTLF